MSFVLGKFIFAFNYHYHIVLYIFKVSRIEDRLAQSAIYLLHS